MIGALKERGYKALVVRLMPTFKGSVLDDDSEDFGHLGLRLVSTIAIIIPRLGYIPKAGDRYESHLGYTFASAVAWGQLLVRDRYLGACVAFVPRYGVHSSGTRGSPAPSPALRVSTKVFYSLDRFRTTSTVSKPAIRLALRTIDPVSAGSV